MSNVPLNPWSLLAGDGSKDFIKKLKTDVNVNRVTMHCEGFPYTVELDAPLQSGEEIRQLKNPVTGNMYATAVKVRAEEPQEAVSTMVKKREVTTAHTKAIRQLQRRLNIKDLAGDRKACKAHRKMCKTIDKINKLNAKTIRPPRLPETDN